MTTFNPIDPLVSDILERLKDEYTAHVFYTNAANYCNRTGLLRAESYFRNEAADELVHASKLQSFLNDYNIEYVIPSIELTPSFDSLRSVIEQSYDIEVALYKAYNDTAIKADDIDKPTYCLTLEMCTIQRESVADYLTKMDMFELTTDMLIYEKAAFKM